jgi:hypothetical protein
VRKPGGTPVEPAAGTAALQKNPAVAEAARALRQVRHEILRDKGWSLRELYKSLETPGENRLREAHAALAAAVRRACGMKPDEDILAFLLKLNLELADREAKGKPAKVALTAVMRKLIVRMNRILKNPHFVLQN